MKRILLLETLAADATAWLESRHQVVLADAPDQFESALATGEFDALITRGKGQVNAAILDRLAPSLKVVSRCGVGLDNVDVSACTERGIPVVNAPGATTVAVTEQTMFLILAAVRNLLPVCAATKKGNWESRDSYTGDDLYGKRLGLIGMGDIASGVADIASAFGMEVVFWNHREKESNYEQVDFDELISTSDVISIHVPLTDETRGIIGAEEFDQMKPEAILINTGRGPHVNHKALETALDRERIAGYAADVFDPEPPNAEQIGLLQRPNVIVTPHISALTRGSFDRMSMRTAKNVDAILREGSPESGCIFNADKLS